MLYQTKYGKTLEISTEQYLDMTDEELDNLDMYPVGHMVDDPWFGSVISKFPPDDLLDFDWEDLTEVPTAEKMFEPDLDISFVNEE